MPELVTFLLQECHVDINARGYDGKSPLHVAALHGDIKLAQLLIGFGADINARSESGITPLMSTQYSRFVGADKVAELLLNQGARLDIYSALKLGSIDDARQIVASDPNSLQGFQGEATTLLISAVISTKEFELLRSILECGLVISADTFTWFLRQRDESSLDAVRLLANFTDPPHCQWDPSEMLSVAIKERNVPAQKTLSELVDKRT